MAHDKKTQVPLPPKAEEEPAQGYILNKGMPPFVGDTEIKRLQKVVEQKNAAIEAFKKYDEERKKYCENLLEEYNEMKSFVESFAEELKEIYADGELDDQDYRTMVKLYVKWYTYKNNAQFYHEKLKGARGSVKDLKEDLTKLEDLVSGIGDFRAAGRVVERFGIIRQHLDTLTGKLSD